MTKRQRAKEAFKTPWLQASKRELHSCTKTLNSKIDKERRRSMEAYREHLQDKLKNHHQKLGTIKCELALEQRKRSCCVDGLLRKEHRHVVKSLFQLLPTVTELREPSQGQGGKSSDEEADISSHQFLLRQRETQLQHAPAQPPSTRESPLSQRETQETNVLTAFQAIFSVKNNSLLGVIKTIISEQFV